jgi:Leucine-rich repeat (LRR) protein
MLKKLQLNGNKIENLDCLPSMPMLEEFNLEGNLIKDNKEVIKFVILNKLSGILLANNPLSDEKGDDFKKFVLT